MLYFRTRESNKLSDFVHHPRYKAMAIYGRRRTGKTALILDYIENNPNELLTYYQCTTFDYLGCLKDFVSVLSSFNAQYKPLLQNLTTFRDVFTLLSTTTLQHPKVLIIDEFPFLAKKNENVTVEFQWIVDHALSGMKLILLGSNLSFMKNQIQNDQSPLYGRFDIILELLPFSFSDVHQLFPVFEDAVEVFAQTGGVPQYVMYFRDYPSVPKASESLLFDRSGRLFLEAPNLLMQELKDITTYVSILRVLGGSAKNSSKIAKQSNMEQRNVYPYLNKLIDLEIVSIVDNPLAEKNEHLYRISDSLFRFHYTFLEPNISLISTFPEKSRSFILNDQYHEFLGFVYEDIIRANIFQYALDYNLPFIPRKIGKWWGQCKSDGSWKETEVDLIAYDDHYLIAGECNYRNKAIGLGELDALKVKTQYIHAKGRELYYLLASKVGFTKELTSLKDPHVILISPC